jgi:hypothetical protein
MDALHPALQVLQAESAALLAGDVKVQLTSVANLGADFSARKRKKTCLRVMLLRLD